MDKNKYALSLVGKEFIYGGHIQSLGASSIVYVTSVLLNGKVCWGLLLLTYLLFLPVYIYNRYREIKVDRLTNPERTAHYLLYIENIKYILTGILLVIVVLLYLQDNIFLNIYSLTILVFGYLYTERFKSLTKNVIAFKNVYVALVFASLVYFYVLYSETHLYIQTFVIFLFVFIKAFIMQVLLDVKDIQSDSTKKLKTIPSLFGKEKSLHFILLSSVVVSVGFPITFAVVIKLLPPIYIVLIGTLPIVLYSIKLVKLNNYYGYILNSAEFITWGILMFGSLLLYGFLFL